MKYTEKDLIRDFAKITRPTPEQVKKNQIALIKSVHGNQIYDLK